MGGTQVPQERNFFVLLHHDGKINEPWLEEQAIALEESLIAECEGEILGPSVTANFAENGFELDLTVEAESLAEAYVKLGRAMTVVERVAKIKLASDSDQVRTNWTAAPEPVHA